jgi:PhoPQ-activated pathogenicity-related protein
MDRPEPAFNWLLKPHLQFTSIGGCQVHILEVTSLEWVFPEIVIPNGSTNRSPAWKHDVIIFVPPNLEQSQTATVLLEPKQMFFPYETTGNVLSYILDPGSLQADMVARKTGTITVRVLNIPND